MKVNISKLPESEIELRIEVPADDWQGFLTEAARELSKDLEIKGFRPGSAPLNLVEEKIGSARILEKAAGDCVRRYYSEAILANNIEAIGQPEIAVLKIAKGNPFEFKAKVAVLPEIKLPDYRKIASQIKKKKVELTTEEIARLRAEKERLERERLREEILQKIAQSAEMEIPRALIETEAKRMLENFKQQVIQTLQISFEDYLKRVNKTEKEILDQLFPEAEKRLKNSLILKKIGKQENIESTEEEVKRESEKILSRYPDASPLDREGLKEYTKEVIRNGKIFQLLENLTQ